MSLNSEELFTNQQHLAEPNVLGNEDLRSCLFTTKMDELAVLRQMITDYFKILLDCKFLPLEKTLFIGCYNRHWQRAKGWFWFQGFVPSFISFDHH